MKNYLSLIFVMIASASTFLFAAFNYNLVTVIYHISLMIFITACVVGFVVLLSIILKHFLFLRLFVHVMCYSYFISCVLLYSIILSSNYFWGKTVTLSIIKNYSFKFGSFLEALPVQKWFFFIFIILILTIATGAYILFKPKVNRIKSAISKGFLKNNRVLVALIFISIFLSALNFRDNILEVKRTMQFMEEPVLQFAFGNLWGEGNEVAFDKRRYLLGKKDNLCLDTLKFHENAQNRIVIVIVMDALKSSHLPFYGYYRNTAPHLDSIIKSGKAAIIKNAFSPSTNTIGGVAGLFFSRDWNEIGYNGLNLMKYLKKAGYQTYAFLTGYHRDWYGLSALYRGSADFYYESPTNPNSPPDDDLITLEKIKAVRIPPKSFVYIHLHSTHTIGLKNSRFKKYFPDKVGFGTTQKEAITNNYDNGILQADFLAKEIIQKFERERNGAELTIIATSDHGELLGEDNRWSHGGDVHPGLASIPMIIYDKNLAWYANKSLGTLKDIAPTIAHRLGYPIPACWEGMSLGNSDYQLDMEINSIINSNLPLGRIYEENDSVYLDIMNKSGLLQQKLIQTNLGWRSIYSFHNNEN